MTVRVIAFGLPAPQGSKSFKGIAKKTKRAILVESSKKVKPWRAQVKVAAEAVRGDKAPLSGPLRLSIVFTMPKPKSAPKRRKTWPDVRPDLSKLIRSTEDALVDAGLIGDDSLFVEFGRMAKVYPLEDSGALSVPGAVIIIEQISEGERCVQ